MVVPVVKLGTLALKTVSKPIAHHLKKEASLHTTFRQHLNNIAQVNHRLKTRIQRRIYGYRTDVEIRPLNEEKAVRTAANLIGEFFVFTVAGVVVIFQVQRNAKLEARKEEARSHELQVMKQQDEEVARQVEALKRRLEELEQFAKSSIFNIRNSPPKA